MADHRPPLVEPAEHLPAGTADRFGGRDARQRLELLVPGVDTEVGPERHQRVAGAKDRGRLRGALADGAATVKRVHGAARAEASSRPTPSSSGRRPRDGRTWRLPPRRRPRLPPYLRTPNPFSSLESGTIRAGGGVWFAAARIVSVGHPAECSAAGRSPASSRGVRS